MNKFVGLYGGLGALIVGMLMSWESQAGVLLEPFVGYDQEKIEATPTAGSGFTVTNKGFNYGARLGYRFSQGLWLAGEYTMGSGDSESSQAGSSSSTYSKSIAGAVIGYDVNSFRFWGGYGFSAKSTVKDDSGETDFTGTLLKAGAGYMALNKLSINLEYIIPKFDKFESGGVKGDISTIFSKFDSSVVSLSLSFPFDLSGK
ncbi:outer membrane beta-barrel protein [Bdellovibrio svalbardensis]|uniref:Porin family protein n=1 Tax=Bdellovibrio svalbardensis TaxID=2972972 RepID=A0ABT6DMH9_9BACT|nr:outer membrane beta-barrel protein [Bdellovibrio svalbardensis]MDG0817712.1 porin family protein [Bdellovibrio svalbardensis]